MKATIELELQPFSTPNFVRLAKNPDINTDGQAIPIEALDSWTLEKLCDDFRYEVFRKAGKSRPPQEGK